MGGVFRAQKRLNTYQETLTLPMTEQSKFCFKSNVNISGPNN